MYAIALTISYPIQLFPVVKMVEDTKYYKDHVIKFI